MSIDKGLKYQYLEPHLEIIKLPEEIIARYKILNEKCDEILKKIKRRKNGKK